MRLQILALLFSLFVFVLATDNLKDKANIKDALTIFDLYFDNKEYNKLENVLAKNVTIKVGGDRPIQGVAGAIGLLSKITPNGTVSYTIASNLLIKFLAPLDKEGRSNRAEAISSSTIGFFKGNSSDLEFLFAKRKDSLIRTGEPGLGGWRFETRSSRLVGTSGDPKLLGQ